ncbi:MAG: DUF3619 family protein [Aquabacterium sp.]|nr:DUF3619 family protein [Aquabacterium sp.]
MTPSNLSTAGHLPKLEALEGQLALRLTAHLSRGAQALPHDISERLRFSRERALASRRAVAMPSTAPVVLAFGRAATLGGDTPSFWLRLVSALPLLVLAAGLVFIQHHHELQQIAVAVEIDSALLADDLPPAAYGDPGFSEFLRNGDAP